MISSVVEECYNKETYDEEGVLLHVYSDYVSSYSVGEVTFSYYQSGIYLIEKEPDMTCKEMFERNYYETKTIDPYTGKKTCDNHVIFGRAFTEFEDKWY